MRPLLSTLLLTLMLGVVLGGPVQAGPKKHRPQTPATPLQTSPTPRELQCWGLGGIAWHTAQKRDKGIRMSDWLQEAQSNLRQASIKVNIDNIPAWMYRLQDAIIYDLYGYSVSLSADRAQHIIETTCLTDGVDAVLALYHLTPDTNLTTSAPWR
jgi:hypothetical protein